MFGIDDALVMTTGAKLLGGYFDNAAAADRQEAAQQFSAQQYATRYQTQVADMKAAGLNPMLAYTQAPGNSPGGVVSTPGNQYSSAADSVLQSRLNSAQVANIAADTKNKEAQASLIEAEVNEKLASAQNLHTRTSEIEASTRKINEEITNIRNDRDRIEALVYNLAEHTALMREQNKSETIRQQELTLILNKLRIENAISQSDYDAIVKTGGVGRIAREVKPASDIAADWLNPAHWFTRKSSSTVDSTVRKLPPMK